MVLQLNLNLTDTCVSYIEELLEKFLKILASCTQVMNTHILRYMLYMHSTQAVMACVEVHLEALVYVHEEVQIY